MARQTSPRERVVITIILIVVVGTVLLLALRGLAQALNGNSGLGNKPTTITSPSS